MVLEYLFGLSALTLIPFFLSGTEGFPYPFLSPCMYLNSGDMFFQHFYILVIEERSYHELSLFYCWKKSPVDSSQNVSEELSNFSFL